MTLPLPLRLDRIQRAMYEPLTDALAPIRVAWGYNEQSWETVPQEGLLSLTMVGGPQPWLRSGKRGTLLNAADSIDLAVTSVSPSERYVVRLNDFSYFTDVQPGDTIDTIRDRLVDLVNADELETATASPAGLGVLRLTADGLGGLRSLTLSGPLSADAPVLNGESVLVTEGTQAMLVNMQAFSKGREPRNGAWAIIQRALAVMQSEDYVGQMTALGVGVWSKGVVSDLSAVAGGHWETRASCDVNISARAVWVRPVARIETVSGTLAADPSVTVAFGATAP